VSTRLDGSYVEDDDDDDNELHQQNKCNITYNGNKVCFRYVHENAVQMVIVMMIRIIICNIYTALFAK